MKSLAQHETLIAIVGTGLLTIAFYFGVWHSGGGTATQQIHREIAESQSRIDSIPLMLAERAHLQSRLDKQARQAAELNERVPTESHVSDVLHKVASLASQSGLTITRLEPLPSVEFNSYAAQPFHLGCRGTFVDIGKFLAGLETQSRLVTFGDVELTCGSEGQGSANGPLLIQANVHFNVYSRHAKSTKLAENTSSRRSLSSDN